MLQSVRGFLKLFWITLGSIAGIVGLYLGAATVSLEWVFWIAVGLAALIAAFTKILPALFRTYQKLKSFAGIVAQNAQMKLDLENRSNEIVGLKGALTDSRLVGLGEGRAQVRGLVLGAVAKPLKVIGVAVVDGEVALLGEAPESPYIGSRFHLADTTTGQVKGSVEVRSIDPERTTIYLHCVDPVNTRFWEKLLDRADADPSPPLGVELVAYTLPDFEALPPSLPASLEPGEEPQPEELP